MNKKCLFALLAASLSTAFLSGCYSQYQTSASRPGDHPGHGGYGSLGPKGHHGALHGNHYFHDDRWGDDNLPYPRPATPRDAPDPYRN